MSRLLPLIAVLAAALLGGCGAGAETARVDDGIVELRLIDFRIQPQVVRVRRDSLTILVRNDGRLPHALRIEGETAVRLKVSTLLPGEEAARVGVTLGRGTWRMYCPLGNHEELGMHGRLVVR